MDTRIDFYPTHQHGAYKLRPGRAYPFGTTLVPGEVNETENKRTGPVVACLDTSGSMAGAKIDSMRVAAETFLQQMNNEDYLTLISFSTGISVRIQNKKVKDARADAVSVVRGLKADGNTALYDAIAEGAAQIKRSTSPFRTNVMIVLTDGQDTSSKSYKYDANLVKLASANSTSLYTVAYGKDADNNILGGLARQSNGNFYQGTEANIAVICVA